MKRVKQVFCVVLTLLLLYPNASFIGLGADEQPKAAIRFSTDYFAVGQETTVIVDGYEPDELTYEWYVGGARVLHEGASYTPADYELESFIKVVVCKDGSVLGDAERYFSRLPVCYLDTTNRSIKRDRYINGQMTLQGNEQYSKTSLLYDGKIQIKGRGNTTWNAPKKPYKIKLDAKADLFGMGKNKHWVLLANYYDKSSLRNKLAYDMSGAMGMDYQQSVWVDVILNGVCLGVYQLCEHVRVGSTRTNIFDWENAAEDAAGAIAKANGLNKEQKTELEDQMTTDLSWVTTDTVTYGEATYTVTEYYTVPEINGGYLYELDSREDEVSHFRTTRDRIVNIGAPEYLNTNSEMFTAAQEYFQAVEDAVYADDFCTEYQGKTVRYTDLIDLDSFVIGWLVNDIFGNIDFGRKSTFYYKDINGKLFYGPVWDMDYSVDSTASASAHYYTFRTIQDNGRRFMFEMTQDPVFVERARTLYWKLRYGYLEDMLKEGGMIDRYSEYLKEALKNNDAIWSNAFTTDEDTAVMKDWLKLRTIWLDKQYTTNDSLYQAMHAADYTEGMFAQSTDEPAELSITRLPAKLRYEVGEPIDLTGLTLSVTLRSGETQTVAPDSFYVSMAKTGRAENVFEGVAATQGEKTVTLCYRNLRVSFPIKVYSDTVSTAAELIDAIPSTVVATDYGVISAARQYVDALTPQEQAQVQNIGRLVEAESDFDTIIETNRQNDSYILNVRYDGNVCYGGSNVIVFDLIDSPSIRAIQFLNPTGSSPIYTAASDGVTIVCDGRIQTWTIYCSPKAVYSDVLLDGVSAKTLRVTWGEMENETTRFKSVVVPTVVTPEIENGQYRYPAFSAVTAATSAAVEFVQALCGDDVIDGSLVSDSDGKLWSFSVPLSAYGDHEMTFRYICGGQSFLFDRTEHCYLREQVILPPEPPQPPTLISVRIAALPNKTSYRYKSTVDPTGLVLEECYDDGSTKLITQGYAVSPQKLTKTGTQAVTVTYQAFTVSYKVKVSYSFFQRLIRIFLFGFLWY